MGSLGNNIISCSLQEIASWQINMSNIKDNENIRVSLPAMQRGYVWSALQVEGLWDSLVRQLPIGSFLVTPFEEKLVSETSPNQSDLLLLDGQQRATSIAMAFCNPWTDPNYPMALWVDIARPEKNFIDRAFMFRLVTQSHPWGYKRNEQGRLEAKVRREALSAFQKAIQKHKNIKDGDELPREGKYPGFNIAYSWPWDAITPVPFPLLCEAIKEREWESALLKSLNQIRFWQSPMPTGKETACWKEKICKILKEKQGEEYERLSLLVKALPSIIAQTQIPIITVPSHDINKDLWEIDPDDDNSESTPPDAIESLFVRINSAGTPLSGDELIYSTYKAIWPNSQNLIEKIGNNAFILPARLVSTVARLVRSIENENEKDSDKSKRKDDNIDNMPPALTVTQFRSLVHNPDGKYKAALETFMENKAEQLFQKARLFLAGNNDTEGELLLANDEDFRLGSILMENLARTAPNVYFFFLRWLCDNMEKEQRSNVHKHIIGALTSIIFFAPDTNRFIQRLWKCRTQSWWTKSIFCHKKRMEPFEGKLVMLPLPSPDEFKESFNSCLLSRRHGEPRWQSWRWYDNLTATFPIGNSDYENICNKVLGENNENDSNVNRVWFAFWEKLWNERRLVLYAQRFWLDKFFPAYNPASPDQSEDSDRPYDWDHIFPQSYLRGTKQLLPMWKDTWAYTIGNLRAWPLDLNRGDANILPHEKLNPDTIDIRWNHIFETQEQMREASFISDGNWKYWEKIDGNEKTIKQALKEKSDAGYYLQKAMCDRIHALYETWYDSFDLKSIFE